MKRKGDIYVDICSFAITIEYPFFCTIWTITSQWPKVKKMIVQVSNSYTTCVLYSMCLTNAYLWKDARNKFLWFATDEQLLKFIHLDIKRPYQSLVTMQIHSKANVSCPTSHQRLRKKSVYIQQDLNSLHSIPNTRAQTLGHHHHCCWQLLFNPFCRQALIRNLSTDLPAPPIRTIQRSWWRRMDHNRVGSHLYCNKSFSEVCLRAKNSTDT